MMLLSVRNNERQGWLARDEQSDHLTLAFEEGDEDTLQQLPGWR